jgi:hypothetical protein
MHPNRTAVANALGSPRRPMNPKEFTMNDSASIKVGDKIEHRLVPGFAMTVLAVEPCDPSEDHGGASVHDSYKIIDPEGHEDWLCAHDVRTVGA